MSFKNKKIALIAIFEGLLYFYAYLLINLI